MHVVVLGMRGVFRPVTEYLAPLLRRGARITYVVRGEPTPLLQRSCQTVIDLDRLGGTDALVDEIAALHEQAPIDATVSFCEEFMLPAARIAERLGLPMSGSESAVRCTDKAEMRRAMAAAGVPIPAFHHVRTREEYDAAVRTVGFPCVVKPVESSGSRGVRVLHTAAEADACFAWSRGVSLADRGREDLLVEEFADGVEYSAEAVVAGGRVVFAAWTEKFLIGGDFRDEAGHVHPFHFAPEMDARLREVLQATVDAVGIRRGGCHMEFKVAGGEVRVIEIAGRPGGAAIPSLIRMSTGADFLDMLYAAVLGEPVVPPPLRTGWAGVRFVTALEPATVRGGIGRTVRRMPGVVQAGVLSPEGTRVAPGTSGGMRVAFVTARHRDRAALLRLLDTAHDIARAEVLDTVLPAATPAAA